MAKLQQGRGPAQPCPDRPPQTVPPRLDPSANTSKKTCFFAIYGTGHKRALYLSYRALDWTISISATRSSLLEKTEKSQNRAHFWGLPRGSGGGSPLRGPQGAGGSGQAAGPPPRGRPPDRPPPSPPPDRPPPKTLLTVPPRPSPPSHPLLWNAPCATSLVLCFGNGSTG